MDKYTFPVWLPRNKSSLKLRLLVSVFHEIEPEEVQKQLESRKRPKATELPPHFFEIREQMLV